MFDEFEVAKIIKEYNLRLKARQRHFIKVWGIILLVLIIVVVTLTLLLQDMLYDEDLGWIIPTYGSLMLAGSATGFVVSFFYKSKVPFNKYVLPEIYKKINFNEGTNYQCNKSTHYAPFNSVGGLFPRYVTTGIKRHIKGTTSDSIPMDIYDTRLFTSSKNSSRTYFDGIYYVLHKDFNTTLQIRTDGKPKLKGTKYTQIEKYQDIDVYKPEEERISNLDEEFIAFIKHLLKSIEVKSLYLSVVNNEVHLALWTVKHPGRSSKELNRSSLEAFYNYFVNEPKILDMLVDSITY